MEQPEKRYLGDGVYVTVDNGEIILTTENGIEATNTVVMDHSVVTAFLKYIKNLYGVQVI